MWNTWKAFVLTSLMPKFKVPPPPWQRRFGEKGTIKPEPNVSQIFECRFFAPSFFGRISCLNLACLEFIVSYTYGRDGIYCNHAVKINTISSCELKFPLFFCKSAIQLERTTDALERRNVTHLNSDFDRSSHAPSIKDPRPESVSHGGIRRRESSLTRG